VSTLLPADVKLKGNVDKFRQRLKPISVMLPILIGFLAFIHLAMTRALFVITRLLNAFFVTPLSLIFEDIGA